MKLTEYGMSFSDEYDLTYSLLSTMGIEVKKDGTVFDTDTQTIIHFGGKVLKATINPLDIKYAGQGEVMFEPLTNVREVTTMLGYFLDKKQELEGMPFISYYPDEFEDPISGVKYSNITVKRSVGKDILTSAYYCNKCLKFIDMIFRLEDQPVTLNNFDVLVSPKTGEVIPNPNISSLKPRKLFPLTFTKEYE